MKQMRNKKARQIVLDYFGHMFEEERSLYDCYNNPTHKKVVEWLKLQIISQYDHKAEKGSVKVYTYNKNMFTVVYYGCFEREQGIIYVTPKCSYFIPDSFIEKVLRE